MARNSTRRNHQRHEQTRARLRVEQLEDRSLMDAGMAAAAFDTSHILVGFQSGEKVEVKSVEVQEGSSVEETLAAYQESPDYLFAELDYQVSVQATPTDPSYSNLYGMSRINAPAAWDLTTGSLGTVVGIIDTGIDYRHRDLYRNIWINQNEIPSDIRGRLTDLDGDNRITFWDLNNAVNQGADKITDLNGNGYIDGGDILRTRAQGGWADGANAIGETDGYIDDLVGWDFVNNDNDPLDDNNHGTHVAGTIGATANDGVGVAGLNWKVQMMGLKFLAASGSGSTSGAIAALNYAVAHGAQITNNSWGGGGYSAGLVTAISNARNAGHVFVAAAGNSAVNNDLTPHYPSSYNVDNIVSVAATDSADRLASFSNYGATSVDLAAPGVSILSTTANNGYAYFNGTSMATPHVTGVLALVRSRNPGLSSAQLISKVVSNTDYVAGLSGKVATSGRLNAFKAVNSAATDLTGPRVVSAVANSTTSPSSIRVTFSEAINPTSFTAADVTNFTGPNGAIAVQSINAVANSGNTQFDILFASQNRAGSYSFRIGPNIADVAGNLMDQNLNGTRGEASDYFQGSFSVTSAPTTTEFLATPNASIPDRGTLNAYINVSPGITITDLNVKLNITHTYDSDLYITLTSPDNTTRVLVNRRGGSGDNFSNTILDDEAATAISAGRAPFLGSFRADSLLSGFDGKNASGQWRLTIQDLAAYDVGRLNSWSLIITGNPTTTTRLRSVDDASEAMETAPLSDVPASQDGPALDFTSVARLLGRGGDLTGSFSVLGELPSSSSAILANVFAQDHWQLEQGNAPASSEPPTFLTVSSQRQTESLDQLMNFFSSVLDERLF